MKKYLYPSIFTLLLMVSTSVTFSYGEDPSYIEDNLFLIEEAYNQDPGVVQHVNTFYRDFRSDDWAYSFTQEWPILSQEHQLSYTIPVARGDSETGLQDIFLNYRYQIIDDETLAIAPRISLLLPTGDYEKGLGSDVVGYQTNLPISYKLTEELVAHWNLGYTTIPDARSPTGFRANTSLVNYGAALVYHHSYTFDSLIEVVGGSGKVVSDEGGRAGQDMLLINPGIRGAINCESGLQIVPGISFPIGVGPSKDEYGVFLYLSFEHGY